MARSIRTVALPVMLAISLVDGVSAQELTKVDRVGPVAVAVTLVAPPVIGSPFRAKVALDTHSVELDSFAFQGAVVFRGPDGVELPPIAVERVTGSGHHREALLVFDPVGQPGAGHLVVKNVGGVAERVFTWEWR